MRRLFIVSVIALLSLVAAPGTSGAGASPSVGAEREDDPTVELRSIWVVAGGAAAEGRYRVVCDPADSPVWFGTGLSQDGVDGIASGNVSMFTCTGSPQAFVVPLQSRQLFDETSQVPVHRGPAHVGFYLTNCVESRDPCYDWSDGAPATVVRKRFVPPYDQDKNADITLVRNRLLPDGSVRVVYDVTCPGTYSVPLSSTITQVTRRGALRVGHGTGPYDGLYFTCHETDDRFSITVTPTRGRFHAGGRAFIDTYVGDRYEDGTYAEDQHPLRIR